MRLKTGLIAAAFVFAAPLTPAAAQAGPKVAIGTQVTDVNGGAIGTVVAIKGDNLLVKTDRHEALLPRSSFTPAKGKLFFGMTRAQLNAEIEKSLAAASAAVAPGALVKGTGGATVGMLEAVDQATATIKLTSGKSIRVARSGIRGNADGSVMIALTADQLEARVDAVATPASSPTAPESDLAK